MSILSALVISLPLAAVPATIAVGVPSRPLDIVAAPQEGVAPARRDTLPQRRDSLSGRDSVAKALRRVVVTATRGSAYGAGRVTSATKTDTPLRDTPQAVTVVTRALIADQAMQGMSDVVRYIPGIIMGQGEGHRDQPTIRGNASTADFFVDGVRDDAQYLRDVYNVERVEALKGSNAMTFGRGGGGGVINRVTKEADWSRTRTIVLEGGSFDHKRGTLDVGRPFGSRVAARFNGMYEKSAGFRDEMSLERRGLNPTLAFLATPRTAVRIGYEYFHDARTVDRGIPSYRGRPSSADVTTFFGDPDLSHAWARVHSTSALVEHDAGGGLSIRNRTQYVHYDKFYQNVLPGAVDASGGRVALSAYNNATTRANLFNQTDVAYALATGPVRHTLVAGTELGRQGTDNFRNTGYFGGTATTTSVPFASPTVSTPVVFRQSATDADNRVVARVAAVYAQDQIALSPQWQALVGVRYERFDVRFHDDRKGQELRRDDRMISPRAGLVFKPSEPVSLYATTSLSFLPSAGDQFSSLTATTRTLRPERFVNREVGAKWELDERLSLDAALYRLDRSNSAAYDPADPTRTVQTGRQRTVGYELGVTGSVTRDWQVAGGWAAQRATIVSATSAARAGATVPLVPHHTLSLWNTYRLPSAWGVGLGVIHQADMYAAIDNSVTLPGFTRADVALYVPLVRGARAQLNVENLFDRRYYTTSQGNNNIMPGATRTFRISVISAVR